VSGGDGNNPRTAYVPYRRISEGQKQVIEELRITEGGNASSVWNVAGTQVGEVSNLA
jgi:hypothetical protein